MMNAIQTEEALKQGHYDEVLGRLYGEDQLDAQRARYIDILGSFQDHFQDTPHENVHLYSAPGRTEIGGNHTDHQQGCVLAGSVSLDAAAVAAPNGLDEIRVYSKGYPMIRVDLNDLDANEAEYGTTAALIRGVAAEFKRRGYPVEGFDAAVYSNVLGGSGLSSSAAFEILIGLILNDLYAKDQETAETLAQIGQVAENVYFGKPCGLMDQMACSVGGIVAIDFKDPEKPVIRKIPFDLSDAGHVLCIIDSHSGHEDLTDAYASIPEEMKKIAASFGCDHLRQVDEERFMQAWPALRESYGDRAVLRAYHFYLDNRRAQKEAEALENNDFDAFLKLVRESGHSSAQFLQNIVPEGEVKEQSLNIVLALCESLLGDAGASRVHGGGFAGTVQAFVPIEEAEEFKTKIDHVLGEGSCHVLNIRPDGGVVLRTDSES